METKESIKIPKSRKTAAIEMYLIIIGIFAIEMLYILLTQATSSYMSLYIELAVVAFVICTGINYLINTVKTEIPKQQEVKVAPKEVEALPTAVLDKKEEVKDTSSEQNTKTETSNVIEEPPLVIAEGKKESLDENKNISEAISILIKLGYKERLAKVMVYKAYEIIGNADLAQLVRKSLTLETDSI
jgi:hypothetical protein